MTIRVGSVNGTKRLSFLGTILLNIDSIKYELIFTSFLTIFSLLILDYKIFIKAVQKEGVRKLEKREK